MGKKGAKKMQMPSFQQLNVGDIMKKAKQADLDAISGSIEAEKQYSPESFEFRKQGLEALMPLLGMEGAGEDLFSRIKGIGMRDQAVDTAIGSENFQLASQRALEELQMGGALPKDVANMVTRRAAQMGGSVGVLGGPAGRDLAARDLGLTSLDLLNQRLNRSTQIGQFEQGRLDQLGQFNVQMPMNVAQVLEGLRAGQTNRGLGLAGLGQSIARPTVGLGGGELANLEIARINQANQQAMAQAGFANQQQKAKTDANMGMIKGITGGLSSMFGGGMGMG
jgi:hypothetical protein